MIPILAPPRSCSSLIAAMLGQHPSLYAPAELECFTGPTLGHCFEFAERVPAVTMHGLLRSVAQLQSGCQNDATVVAARQWLEDRSHWSGAELVAWIETQIAPRRLIDKSPIHVLRWPSLVLLNAGCTNQPVLHLSRHPIPSIHSLIGAYRRRGQPLTPSDALRTWLLGHRHCLRYRMELAQAPSLLLRSEDLLSEPEASLRRVCSHLGIAEDPATIELMLHPECSPYACLGPSLAPAGNDPNWMAEPSLRRRSTPPLEPSLRDLWDLPDVEPWLVLAAVELGLELGYK
jgi:hypothetical protein